MTKEIVTRTKKCDFYL